jgi:hypothetical protein
VVKLLIALDYLIQQDPGLDLEQAATDEQCMDIPLLRTMLRGSWDYVASVSGCGAGSPMSSAG